MSKSQVRSIQQQVSSSKFPAASFQQQVSSMERLASARVVGTVVGSVVGKKKTLRVVIDSSSSVSDVNADNADTWVCPHPQSPDAPGPDSEPDPCVQLVPVVHPPPRHPLHNPGLPPDVGCKRNNLCLLSSLHAPHQVRSLSGRDIPRTWDGSRRRGVGGGPTWVVRSDCSL